MHGRSRNRSVAGRRTRRPAPRPRTCSRTRRGHDLGDGRYALVRGRDRIRAGSRDRDRFLLGTTEGVMNTTCTFCGGAMKPLFSGYFCPKDCDRKPSLGDLTTFWTWFNQKYRVQFVSTGELIPVWATHGWWARKATFSDAFQEMGKTGSWELHTCGLTAGTVLISLIYGFRLLVLTPV